VRLDLNCDLGEGEPVARTRALMRQVTSVNVACGGHAGDASSMEYCVRLGRELGVRVGAHPGLAGNRGRSETVVSVEELEWVLLQQISALHRLTKVHRMRLHHVKLHGALYHAVEHEQALGQAYVSALSRWFCGVPIYSLAGGRVAALGRSMGVVVWEEAFADRAYRADGSLVPRAEPNALWLDVAKVRERLRRLRAGQGIVAVTGETLAMRPRTVCLHSDTPGSLMLARMAARELSPG